MQINLEFADRHVVVFGGTTGINLGIAKAFARQGAKVTVVSRKRENVSDACAALAEYGGQVNGVCADVRDFEAVGQGLAASVAVFGDIDVLVSGAAGNFLCEAKNMSSNGFKAVVDIDLVGTFHVLRQAFRYMRKPGGVAINITAPQSSIPMRYQAHACAAKAGIDQLTRVLALEWGPVSVRVNAISPGPIGQTEGYKRLIADGNDDDEQTSDNVPLKRLGNVDDIANLALFLASPYASYISGAVIPCDGGGALDSVRPTLEAAGMRATQVGA
jgi:NAD(P)-dependent dehydrogenase (short-subunit alcohol dehydrogenase family)